MRWARVSGSKEGDVSLRYINCTAQELLRFISLDVQGDRRGPARHVEPHLRRTRKWESGSAGAEQIRTRDVVRRQMRRWGMWSSTDEPSSSSGFRSVQLGFWHCCHRGVRWVAACVLSVLRVYGSVLVCFRLHFLGALCLLDALVCLVTCA